MKATAILSDEHKDILRAVTVLEAMGKRTERGELPEAKDVAEILQFLRRFADDHHQGSEESVLFPIVQRLAPAERFETIRHMVFEHDQERSLVIGLEEALHTRKASDFTHYAARLGQVLRNHIAKEDDTLFPAVNAILSAEEDEVVVRGLQAWTPPLKHAALAEIRALLTNLEARYLDSGPEVRQSHDSH